MKRVDIRGMASAALARAAALRDKLRAAPEGGEGAAPRPGPLAGLRHRVAALRGRLPAGGAVAAVTAVKARLAKRSGDAVPSRRLSLPRFALPSLSLPSLDGLRSKATLRNAGLGLASVGIAVTAAQFVQSGAEPAAAPLRTAAVAEATPRAIEPLAATADLSALPVRAAPAEPVAPPVAVVEAEPAPALPAPEVAAPDVTVSAPAPAPVCDTSLVGLTAPGAMIDLVLLAPCAPETDVVLRHAGLAVSGRTSSTGALFATLPALDAGGRVTVRMADGAELAAEVPTDLAGLRRVALQWQAPDLFQLHAFEGGAGYGEAGHLWAGAPGRGGSFLRLGDAGAALPLLAEVYTFPAEAARVTVEAEVTAETCARDMLAETLSAGPLGVERAEVTLAMPACDGIGDFLVLNIPEPRTTLASAAAN